LAAFDGSFPKNLYSCKNLAKIFYASRVIANFVSNFVDMTMGVGQKNAIVSIRRPIFENFFINANISIGAKVSQKSFTQAEL